MSARLTLLSLLARAALRSQRRRLLRRAMLAALAALLALAALACLLLAAGLWLATRVSAVEAALILAAALALPALLLALAAGSSRRSAVEDDLRLQAGQLWDDARAEVRDRPALPLIGAGLAGLILGLWLIDRR